MMVKLPKIVLAGVLVFLTVGIFPPFLMRSDPDSVGIVGRINPERSLELVERRSRRISQLNLCTGLVHAASSQVNLLLNPSFEEVEKDVPTFWTPQHSTTFFEATTLMVKEGTRSAILSKVSGKKGWTAAYQEVEATPSVDYKLSGWVFWNDDAVSKVSLRLKWLDDLGDMVGSASEIVAGVRSAAFQFLELLESAPVGTETARIELFTNLSESGPANPALFDALWFGEFVEGGDSSEDSDSSDTSGDEEEEEEDDVEPQIDFEIPDSVIAGEGFEVNLSLENFDPDSEYRVKFLASPEGEGKFYDGKTLSDDEEKYLAWNASWNDFPRFETDSSGVAGFDFEALIKDEAEAGDHEAKVRVYNVATGDSIDSDVKGLKIEEPDVSEVSEEDSEVLGALAPTQLPVTGPSEDFGLLLGEVFLCLGLALKLLLISFF